MQPRSQEFISDHWWHLINQSDKNFPHGKIHYESYCTVRPTLALFNNPLDTWNLGPLDALLKAVRSCAIPKLQLEPYSICHVLSDRVLPICQSISLISDSDFSVERRPISETLVLVIFCASQRLHQHGNKIAHLRALAGRACTQYLPVHCTDTQRGLPGTSGMASKMERGPNHP